MVGLGRCGTLLLLTCLVPRAVLETACLPLPAPLPAGAVANDSVTV